MVKRNYRFFVLLFALLFAQQNSCGAKAFRHILEGCFYLGVAGAAPLLSYGFVNRKARVFVNDEIVFFNGETEPREPNWKEKNLTTIGRTRPAS